MANPPPSYAVGRVCIIGDAAHATSPHHGAGAGLGIEDSAVLAEMLADKLVVSPEMLATVFSTFDAQRKERGRFLVESSRFIGDCYEWQVDSVGSDLKAIEAEIRWRNDRIANVDLVEMCKIARAELSRRIQVMASI